jgi:hypothetical protein
LIVAVQRSLTFMLVRQSSAALPSALPSNSPLAKTYRRRRQARPIRNKSRGPILRLLLSKTTD